MNEFKKLLGKGNRFFLNKQNVILTFIISLLGFMPSCHHTEYGVPTAEFILNGKVISASTNQPIGNIKISSYGNYNNLVVFTNNEGYFSIHFNGDAYTKNYTYKFQDIDSTQNLYFKDKDTVISYEGIALTGGDGKWNEGVAEKTVAILLEPK